MQTVNQLLVTSWNFLLLSVVINIPGRCYSEAQAGDRRCTTPTKDGLRLKNPNHFPGSNPRPWNKSWER